MEKQQTLTIDIGNSLVKVALFEARRCLYSHHYTTQELPDIQSVYNRHDIRRTIISSVNHAVYSTLADMLETMGIPYTTLDHHTPLPFTIDYRTPHTLGLDRIAAIAGATSLHHTAPMLVIDAGTCITYDLVADNRFLGGNIAPGIRMRLEAMHHYTSALPLVEIDGQVAPVGRDTTSAIQAGAFWGTVYEIKSYIHRYKQQHPTLITILTGGDAPLLLSAEDTADDIEHQPLLVPIGLNFIANHLSK